MKELYSYQEIRPLIEQGTPVAFRRQLEVQVTAIQHCSDRDTISAVLRLSLGDYFLGEVECEFTTIALLLDAFALHEQAERWEVANEERACS